MQQTPLTGATAGGDLEIVNLKTAFTHARYSNHLHFPSTLLEPRRAYHDMLEYGGTRTKPAPT
jgi:hypothetical protein